MSKRNPLLLLEMKVLLIKDCVEECVFVLNSAGTHCIYLCPVLFNFKQNTTAQPSQSPLHINEAEALSSDLYCHFTWAWQGGVDQRPGAWCELTSADGGHFGSDCAPQPWLSCTQCVSCTAQPSSPTTAYQSWWDRQGVNISQLCDVTSPPGGWTVN